MRKEETSKEAALTEITAREGSSKSKKKATVCPSLVLPAQNMLLESQPNKESMNALSKPTENYAAPISGKRTRIVLFRTIRKNLRDFKEGICSTYTLTGDNHINADQYT